MGNRKQLLFFGGAEAEVVSQMTANVKTGSLL
jgi:hypothetical protein